MSATLAPALTGWRRAVLVAFPAAALAVRFTPCTCGLVFAAAATFFVAAGFPAPATFLAATTFSAVAGLARAPTFLPETRRGAAAFGADPDGEAFFAAGFFGDADTLAPRVPPADGRAGGTRGAGRA